MRMIRNECHSVVESRSRNCQQLLGEISTSTERAVKKREELLEHHTEEEEQEMFTDAAKLMSKEQLKTLGKQMEEKKNLKKAAWSAPDNQNRTSRKWWVV